ncbi:hypothetical protein BGZ68_001632 [Mortierella alpina]|nr:hypothetical protein BGZ68_001632 [Mortierella alpina]
MNETQSFRLIGGTEIVKLPVQHVDGQSVVYRETIEQAFPRVKCVKNGDVPVPCFIKHVPDVILDVALSSIIDPVRNNSSAGVPSMVSTMALNSALTSGGTNARASDPSSLDDSIQDLRVTCALEDTPIDNIGALIPFSGSSDLPASSTSQVMTSSKTMLSFRQVVQLVSKKAPESDGQVQHLRAEMARMIQLQEVSSDKQDKMSQMTIDQHEEIMQLQKASAAKQEEMTQLQKESDAKQEQMLLLQKQLRKDGAEQQRILDQVSELHARVQVVLTQTFELHEYPVPRLFVVLPEDPSAWNAVKPFSNKFRLYFLCECGEHTKALNSKTKIPHHIHLAKHEGYVVARPSEFFEQYGDYVLTILKMLKYGVTVAGVVMPAFSQLVSPDGLGQTLASLELLQKTIVPGVDHVITSIDKTAADESNVVDGVDAQMNIKEALEGVELRKLGTFL